MMNWRTICLLALKLGIISLFLSPFLDSAFALDETFDVYSSPQGLAMGNAFTANASGYASLYYNPAGLAKGTSRQWEITPVAIEGYPGVGGIGTAIGAKNLGMYRLFEQARANPGRYNYFRFNALPSAVGKGFGVALLGTYEYASKSDGTQIDLNAGTDLGFTIGYGRNFAGNLIKIGIAAKAILRNRLEGVYDHSAFSSEEATKALMKEGLGFGGDLGILVTLPMDYLPTLGVVWKDMFGTKFHPSRSFNPLASGVPASIAQSFNAGFSLHPSFARDLKTTISAEMRHIERVDLPLRKRLHFGFQAEIRKSFFLWAGLNQMYLTAGMGLRVKGGNLEVGSYAQDVGPGTEAAGDRRFLFRYTIGF